MNDPLANAYLKILEEGVPSSEVKGTTTKPSDAPYGDKKNNLVKKVSPKSATENADSEMDDVEEAPAELTSNGSDGEAKKLGEASNPFDALFNKILEEEEAFNFSTEDNSLEPDSSFDMNTNDDGLDEFDDETEETEGEEVTLTLSRELAEKLHEALMGVLENSEEESEDLGEDLGEEGEEGGEIEETEEVKEEAVDAEVVGHALVDSEKLNKGLNSHSNKVVKGAVPVTSKSAETPQTGKGCDGELKSHSTEPAVKKLQSKKDNVGGVTVGKTLFDN